MAGNENSGGFRPTAPQNNPANVSATGGNGQSGKATQPSRYISGLPYGQGQETLAQQTAAPMAGKPEVPTIDMPTPLLAPTSRPNEPITDGINIGPGRGSEVMADRPSDTKTLADTIRELIRFDPSGDTELIYRALTDEGY